MSHDPLVGLPVCRCTWAKTCGRGDVCHARKHNEEAQPDCFSLDNTSERMDTVSKTKTAKKGR